MLHELRDLLRVAALQYEGDLRILQGVALHAERRLAIRQREPGLDLEVPRLTEHVQREPAAFNAPGRERSLAGHTRFDVQFYAVGLDIEGELLVRGQAQAAHGFTQAHPRTASQDPGLEVATRMDERPRDRSLLRPIPGHRAIEEAVILADATEAMQADLRALGVGVHEDFNGAERGLHEREVLE